MFLSVKLNFPSIHNCMSTPILSYKANVVNASQSR